MKDIQIVEASLTDVSDIALLVNELLTELDSSLANSPDNSQLEELTSNLLSSGKIWIFLAKFDDKAIGVITLHECAAIYAGGLFGEISELYVKPDYRSFKVGEMLLNNATEQAKRLDWKRLEVGTPPPSESPRTIQFYQRMGFDCTGSRLRKRI